MENYSLTISLLPFQYPIFYMIFFSSFLFIFSHANFKREWIVKLTIDGGDGELKFWAPGCREKLLTVFNSKELKKEENKLEQGRSSSIRKVRVPCITLYVYTSTESTFIFFFWLGHAWLVLKYCSRWSYLEIWFVKYYFEILETREKLIKMKIKHSYVSSFQNFLCKYLYNMF